MPKPNLSSPSQWQEFSLVTRKHEIFFPVQFRGWKGANAYPSENSNISDFDENKT